MQKTTGITAILLLFIQISFAQYIIKGRVIDEQKQPIEQVNIAVGKQILTVITDSAGNYSFPSSRIDISISFSHIGYETATVNYWKEQMPDIILSRSNVFLSETVVHAFERNSNIKNIPASVSVLSKASLERYNNESFVPAINTVPGVKMDERSPGSYRLSIRGNLLRSTFGVRNVKVYWNGIPFTDANGNTYFNELGLGNIGKIEILKGPSGSMYGSGTGGVVLLNSDLNSIKEKNLTIQSTAGSYGLFSANASYNQSGKNSASSLSYSHLQSDGYRKQTGMRRDVANFTGTYSISSRQNINANIFYSDLYYQTPGGLTMAEMMKDPRQARPKAGAFESAEAQQAAIYLKTLYAGFGNEYQFNSHWNNNTAVYFSNTNFRNPTIRNYERKTEQGMGVRSVMKYKSQLFTGTFGAEYQYGFTNTSTFANKLGQIDTLQIHDEIDSRQFNIFLQADVSLLEDFILNAGVSYNNFYYGFVRLNQLPAEKASSNFTPQFVPRVSLLKKINNKLSVFAAVSKGYSPPSIDEVHGGDGNFNTALKAETGVNYEAGIKGDIIKNKLYLDASYYLFGLTNTIVNRKDSSGGDYYVNAGKTKQKGLEASVNYIPVNNNNKFIRLLKLWANYTNIHARFTNYTQAAAKYDGNKLTGTSPNVFVAGADINSRIGLYTNLTYTYTDQIPLNDANTYYATAYNLLAARVGYRINISRSVSTDIFLSYNKSFNEPYSLGNDLNATGNRYYNPSAPETFSGGLKLKFILK